MIKKYFRRWQVISKEQQHQLNEAIRASEVRLIAKDGEQLGVRPFDEALRLAHEANMDLVNVAPQAKPPVCRIMDYGKFCYEQRRREKEARRNQQVMRMKEVRLSPSIAAHDIQTKMSKIKDFLGQGDKVKLTIRFRGREMAHQHIGRRILERVAEDVQDICEVERKARVEGRQMIMILSPKAQQIAAGVEKQQKEG